MGDAVVVGEGEVDRLDTALVVLALGDAVEAPGRMGGALAEFVFEGLDELLEEIEEEGVRLAQAGHRVGVDQGVEDDRAQAGFDGRVADLHGAVAGLVGGVDEGHAVRLEAGIRKLGEETVAEGLGRDAGAV